MGMFDSFYDKDGNEWQTKAFRRVLDRFEIGDTLPDMSIPVPEYQVEVLGGPIRDPRDSLALISDGRLKDVPVDRNRNLPLFDYHGRWRTPPNGEYDPPELKFLLSRAWQEGFNSLFDGPEHLVSPDNNPYLEPGDWWCSGCKQHYPSDSTHSRSHSARNA